MRIIILDILYCCHYLEILFFCAIPETKEESTVDSAGTIVTTVTTISPADAPLTLLSRAQFRLHSANPLIPQKSRNVIENKVMANRLYLIGGYKVSTYKDDVQKYGS
ncbi:MAG: hypothetical protein VYD14_03120 [SAR324 cluster bacterium]|nr:hypothetical protein [SAR324 cluster bacterium]